MAASSIMFCASWPRDMMRHIRAPLIVAGMGLALASCSGDRSDEESECRSTPLPDLMPPLAQLY